LRASHTCIHYKGILQPTSFLTNTLRLRMSSWSSASQIWYRPFSTLRSTETSKLSPKFLSFWSNFQEVSNIKLTARAKKNALIKS